MHIDICGCDLHWESFGQGFPLVCLHGSGVDHRAIASGMEPVCREKEGFYRIYPDLPGMGLSQSHDRILGSDDMLEMVCQFIDAVVGEEKPFALAGYSYGGYLARGVLCQMASRVRGLLLVCPVTGSRRKGRRLPEFRVSWQDPELMASLTPSERAHLDGFITMQTPEVWEGYCTHILPALDMADARLMDRLRDSEFSFAVDRGSHDLPVAILTGQVDVAVGYADAFGLMAHFPEATYAVLARAGHLLHLEQPGLFGAHVRTWLDRIDCTP